MAPRALARLLDRPWPDPNVHNLWWLLVVPRHLRRSPLFSPSQRRHHHQIPNSFLSFGSSIADLEFISNKIEKRRVKFGIREALLEPVVAEPWRGPDEAPPLVGEILHRTANQHLTLMGCKKFGYSHKKWCQTGGGWVLLENS